MSLVALIWVTLQNFGAALVGLVLLVSASPTLAAAPVAGVVVDRLGVRRAVVLDNSIRCLAAAVLAGVLWTGATSVPVLLAYAVLAGLTGPITEVAVDTATPAVVADEELDRANILLSTVWDLADLTGPVAAGLLIDAFGVPSSSPSTRSLSWAWPSSFLTSPARLPQLPPQLPPAQLRNVGWAVGSGCCSPPTGLRCG